MKMASAFTVTLGETVITGLPAALIILGFLGVIFLAGYLAGRA